MKAIVPALRSLVQRHWIFFVFFFLFFLMLLRNPFSERTLIPNLEPYPDSFHYIDAAFSFLNGKGFVIEREGRVIEPSVPPLYSLVLAPVFLLIPDVRAFYIVNVALALTAFGLFTLIVRKLFVKPVIWMLLLLLYVTSYPLYWFPTLAMAENLLLPLYLLAILLLISRSTRRRAVVAGAVAISFYSTKYASLPLSLCFPILYAIKLFWEPRLAKKNKKKTLAILERFKASKGLWISYGLSLLFFGGLFLVYERIVEGSTIIGRILNVFSYVLFPKPEVKAAAVEQVGQPTVARDVFFSTRFMAENTSVYIRWLLGKPMTVLWKSITILPQALALPSLIGLGVATVKGRQRFIAFCLLTMLLMVLAFMSVFYVYDGRYVFIAIPTLFLGLGFFFNLLFELFAKHRKALTLLIVIVAGVMFVSRAQQLKFNIMLNLKYAETPWYYISIRTFDEYLQEHKTEFDKTPVMISALPPYLIDAYAKEPMIIVPLHAQQEFRSYPKQAWGDINVENLPEVYTSFLNQGHDVFLTEYGLGNEAYLHQSYDEILASFSSTKVFSGCHDLCDIYKLSLTPATSSAAIKPTKEGVRL